MKQRRNFRKKAISDRSPTELFWNISLSTIVFSIVALLGVNAAYIFGFTLRMNLGAKSMIDSTFILSTSYPFFIFIAGSAVYFKILLLSNELSRSKNFVKVEALSKVLDVTPKGFSKFFSAILLISLYWIVAFPLLDFIPYIFFIFSITQVFLFFFLFFRYDPSTGTRFQPGMTFSAFFTYIEHSAQWKRYLTSPTLLKFNVLVALIVSVSLGAARFHSLMANTNYCIKTTDSLLKGAIVAQSSEYIFLGPSSGKISYFSIYKRYDTTLIRKSDVVYIGVGECRW